MLFLAHVCLEQCVAAVKYLVLFIAPNNVRSVFFIIVGTFVTASRTVKLPWEVFVYFSNAFVSVGFRHEANAFKTCAYGFWCTYV